MSNTFLLEEFGAKNHKYQWNPPASLKEIEEFEQETGISLPDGYRNFLLQAGDGLSLDGDEETLRKLYVQADTDAERLLAVSSMDKFPALSEASQDFIRRILDDWIAKEYVDSLPLLAYRVDPALYEQFLDKRWEVGVFDRVVYELYHTPAERKELAKSWRERLMDKLPELSPETYCIAIPLLRMGGEVKLEQYPALREEYRQYTILPEEYAAKLLEI